MRKISSSVPEGKGKVTYEKRKSQTFRTHAKNYKNEIMTSKRNAPQKKVKKIKIRLADPNIPDSYICEVFDSSLENDEEDSSTDCFDINGTAKRSLRSHTVKKKSKAKDYFDILMSKESRQSFTLNTAILNNEIPEETKLLRTVDSEDVIKNRKVAKAKNKQKLIELVHKKRNSNCYNSSSSSDDECIFKVQSKLRFSSAASRGNQVSDDLEKKTSSKTENNKENKDEGDEKFSKVSLITEKKYPNILNYFSKTISNKTKSNGKGKVRKLKEFDMFKAAGKESLSVEGEVVPDGGIPSKKGASTCGGFEGGDNLRRNDVPRRDNRGSDKLAPLFYKKTKVSVDPDRRRAQLQFLQSGLPSSMRKAFNSRQVSDTKYSVVHFPATSHIQQRDDDSMWTSRNVSISNLRPDEGNRYPGSSGKTFRYRIVGDFGAAELSDSDKKFKLDSFNSLRSRYKNVDVASIYDGLREKREIFLKKLDSANAANSKMADLNESVTVIDVNEDAEVYNSLWTDIYKPNSADMIGNKGAVKKLGEWLRTWKEYDSEIKRLARSGIRVAANKVTVTDDSDDDFVPDGGNSLDLRTPGNICLLSGPISAGKTALVYALASELEFNVLEVNASSKRTGKKLLALQEATKSHQVRSGFGQSTGADNETERGGRKGKSGKRKVEADMNRISNASGNGKISLILIEDADIFFEDHDEGYVSALSTLVQSSKRPFIFLSNEPNCGYFDRLKSQPVLCLEMRRPNFHNMCAVLDIIAFLEGVPVDNDRLQSLIRNNGLDFRKSLLELQFWVQSGKNLSGKLQGPLQLGKLWWGFNNFLYNKDSFHHLKINYRKRKRTDSFYDSSSDEEPSKKVKLSGNSSGDSSRRGNPSAELKSESKVGFHSRILDCLSLVDAFKVGDGDREPIPPTRSGPRDSLSLGEHTDAAEWNSKDLSRKIVNELLKVSVKDFKNKCRDGANADNLLRDPSWNEIRWRTIQEEARRDLESLVPLNGGNCKRALHVDYLPIIRNMCRTEKIRYAGNTKRKNRFHHYLKTLAADLREESLDVGCDALDT